MAPTMFQTEGKRNQSHQRAGDKSPSARMKSTSPQFIANMTPKSLTKYSIERVAATTSQQPPQSRTITIDLVTPDVETTRHRNSNGSAVSGRSNSTTSAQSNDSADSNHSKRSSNSWSRVLFGGMRSKSSGALNTLGNVDAIYLEHDLPAVPDCLQAHETRLRRICECTQKNVNGLIVRTQHTESDIMQMVARHCNHVGCRRKLINAAMRNLERRISMLNKYRDAIFHFVVNKHQEVVRTLPSKKAEADALFDMCQRNSKACMDLANQGAHQSGTLLVSIAERLHKLQKQLMESSPDDFIPPPNAPTRSMSALSVHSHGEGELDDYVMAVVPTVPQPITFKLSRPPRNSCQSNNGGSHGFLTAGGCSSPFGSPQPVSVSSATGTRSSKVGRGPTQ